LEFAALATGQVRKLTDRDFAIYMRPQKSDLAVEGDAYIVSSEDATGVWAGHANHIAVYHGGWLFIEPYIGREVYVEDEKGYVRWNGTSWGNRIPGLMNNPEEVYDRWIKPSGGPSLSNDAFTPRDYHTNIVPIQGSLYVFSNGGFPTSEHFPQFYVRDAHPGGTGGASYGWSGGGGIRRMGGEQGFEFHAFDDTAEVALGSIETDGYGHVIAWNAGGSQICGRIYGMSMGVHATTGEMAWNGRSGELSFIDSRPGGILQWSTTVQDTFAPRAAVWKLDSNYPASALRTAMFFNFNGTDPEAPATGQAGWQNVRYNTLANLLAGDPESYYVLYMEAPFS
jgi:hypothetical protein